MKNHFKTLEIEQKFDLDLEDLEVKYFTFQKRFHPDSAGIDEIEKSIAVNEAFDVLNSPILRASHILQLNGIDLENDEKAPRPDFATLEEVLEIQEKIAEMNDDEKNNMRKNIAKKISKLLEEVALKLENKDFEQAAQILIKAKYFDKTLRDLKKK